MGAPGYPYVADDTGQFVMYEAVAQMSRQMRCGAAPTDASWKAAIDRDRKARKRG